MWLRWRTVRFRVGRMMRPYSISCGTALLIESMGMAKPTPAEVPDWVKMAVFTPITRP